MVANGLAMKRVLFTDLKRKNIMEAKEIRKELEENYGYTFVEKDEWQFNFIMGLITDVSEVVKKNALLACVSKQSELLSCDNGCDWQLKGIQSNDYLECSRCGKRKAT